VIIVAVIAAMTVVEHGVYYASIRPSVLLSVSLL